MLDHDTMTEYYDMKNYITDAMRTTNADQLQGMSSRLKQVADDNALMNMMHALLGVASESGEWVDAWKRFLMYGKPLDLVNLDEEVGDVLWYLSLYLYARNKNFADVMYQNIEKLKARYPEKFTDHHALNRDLIKEREILEQNS